MGKKDIKYNIKFNIVVAIFLTILIGPLAWAKTVTQFTQGMQLRKGFFNYYQNPVDGHIYMEINRFHQDFLYQVGVGSGVGSNRIGIDRNSLGEARVVRFERFGNRVLMHQPNQDFRADYGNDNERRAVKESFATSVLWGFDIAAESDKKILVDLTPFLLDDQYGTAQKLKRRQQGNFKPDPRRSAIYSPRTKNFPYNSEFESILTFQTSAPGSNTREVVPSPQAVTIRQHISFIRLPDDQYTPRPFNINSGFYPLEYKDYSTPIEAPITQRLLTRHRLQKKNPDADISEPVKPIVYYVDSAAPEPIRTALLEGASWWNAAFEAAGFRNAFLVKILPSDADPMDVRYNVINWVHRDSRGWSYGGSITDPRTGEIIKGHVTLGSLRIRQDILIAQGLLTPYSTETNSAVETMKETALARIRQLSAHEVGHTLGLTHNFASSHDRRSSVMDYPHPMVRLIQGNEKNGKPRLDFSRAYTDGIGEWDKVAICCGYGEVPKGMDQKTYMQSVIDKAFSKGMRYMSDPDSIGGHNLHAFSHQWDNGRDPLEELKRLTALRRFAIDKFSTDAIPMGEPMSTLEEVLVPLYFSCRYQLDAVAKMVGGMTYAYTIRREIRDNAFTLIPPNRQWQAVDALLATLSPKFLALPEKVLNLIPPKAYGYKRSHESFPAHTGRSFDAVAMTEASASQTLELLLNSRRAARLIEYHARDPRYPGFEELLKRITAATVKASFKNGLEGVILRRVNHVYLHHLMLLAQNPTVSESVKATAIYHLNNLKNWLKQHPKLPRQLSQGYPAHFYYEARRIERFLDGRYSPDPNELKQMPPGSPI
jgi:hypothetical protein